MAKSSLKFSLADIDGSEEPPLFGAEEIRAIRERLGIPKEKFASMLGVRVATLTAWEAGRGGPNPTARRMLELFTDREALRRFAAIVGAKLG